MGRILPFIKKYWKNFDDTLFKPQRIETETKNFKGQPILKRKFGQSIQPNPEQVLSRARTMQDEQIRMHPRDIRAKNWLYLSGFAVWYVGVTLFIMYRMKGDDLDSLEREAMAREKRKREIGV